VSGSHHEQRYVITTAEKIKEKEEKIRQLKEEIKCLIARQAEEDIDQMTSS
jgi:hypothetical protein